MQPSCHRLEHIHESVPSDSTWLNVAPGWWWHLEKCNVWRVAFDRRWSYGTEAHTNMHTWNRADRSQGSNGGGANDHPTTLQSSASEFPQAESCALLPSLSFWGSAKSNCLRGVGGGESKNEACTCRSSSTDMHTPVSVHVCEVNGVVYTDAGVYVCVFAEANLDICLSNVKAI